MSENYIDSASESDSSWEPQANYHDASEYLEAEFQAEFARVKKMEDAIKQLQVQVDELKRKIEPKASDKLRESLKEQEAIIQKLRASKEVFEKDVEKRREAGLKKQFQKDVKGSQKPR